MSVSDWATVFTASLFKNRLHRDYLSYSDAYLRDYRQALKDMGKSIPAPDRVLATVLFTDVVNSTGLLSSMGDKAWNQLLDRHNELIRSEIERWRGQEVSTAGDSFFATFDGTARAVQAAHAMVEEVVQLGIEIRAGLHTGEVEIVDGRAAGAAVHIGARISSLAGPSEVLVSRTVKETITGSGFTFDDRGFHQLKGVPGEWQLYATVP
ncbi:MAG: adenylate/guanylate cyclase domain-containing protein [Acidimicrobiia bacterium]